MGYPEFSQKFLDDMIENSNEAFIHKFFKRLQALKLLDPKTLLKSDILYSYAMPEILTKKVSLLAFLSQIALK